MFNDVKRRNVAQVNPVVAAIALIGMCFARPKTVFSDAVEPSPVEGCSRHFEARARAIAANSTPSRLSLAVHRTTR
jgi:hypothetical protein